MAKAITMDTCADLFKYREAFNKYSKIDFQYGEMDCVKFVSEVIKHVHGIDHAAPFIYKSKTSAYKMMNRFGGFSELIDYVLGEPKIEIDDGDVVLCEDEVNGEFLGIWMKNKVIAKTATGLISVPGDSVKRRWSCLVL